MRTEPQETPHTVEAADGWRLSVLDVLPIGRPRAWVIAGHAMMADARTVYRPDRPSLAGTLREAGFRLLVPDLRGRRGSGPTPDRGGDWSYDDLVDDVGVYLRLAKDLDETLPIALAGHSLFGHNSLGYLGRYGDADVAVVVLLSAVVWTARGEPRRHTYWLKRGLLEAVWGLSRGVGRVPARRLRVGSADESVGYWRDFKDFMRHGWRARDGFDYEAALGRIDCPVLEIASQGDWICPPAAARRFLEPLAGRARVLGVGPQATEPRLRRTDPPNHMGMLTDTRSGPIWDVVADWLVDSVARPSTSVSTSAPETP